VKSAVLVIFVVAGIAYVRRDNLVPFIPKEEEKVAKETGKILGRLGEGTIAPHPMLVGATCTRAAILDGHTAAVAIETEKPCSPEAAAEAMRAFGGDYAGMDLPSAPKHPMFDHLMAMSDAGVQVFVRQDQDATTKVQRGMHSRFAARGRYSWQEESHVQFNRWLVQRYRRHWPETVRS